MRLPREAQVFEACTTLSGFASHHADYRRRPGGIGTELNFPSLWLLVSLGMLSRQPPTSLYLLVFAQSAQPSEGATTWQVLAQTPEEVANFFPDFDANGDGVAEKAFDSTADGRTRSRRHCHGMHARLNRTRIS